MPICSKTYPYESVGFSGPDLQDFARFYQRAATSNRTLGQEGRRLTAAGIGQAQGRVAVVAESYPL